MLPLLVRHGVYPFHEWLLRRPTLRYLRDLEWSQWSSPSDLRELQRAKLQELLRHAHRHTAFYRRRFNEAGVDVESADPTTALARLPLLDKAEIRAAGRDVIWYDAPGGVFEHSTGGSTGEPLIFHVDRRRQACDQAARIRTHRWFGVDIGDRELYLWGSPIEWGRTDSLKRLRDALCNQRLLDAFHVSSTRMDSYLNEWDRFKPLCLFGYPSSVALWVEHARSRGRRLDTRGLRAVFVTGEVCYPHDREAIANYFGVPVADGYGSREAGFIAHECPLGRMHLTTESVIVEIIENDECVPVGETGEIVVTHLDAYAMPFIRYRTGDVGRLLPGRCPCGRGLPLMDVVQGRSTDFLYTPDGDVKHALSIIYPLRAMKGIRRFRVTQHADYAVTVDVVSDDRLERVTREAVVRQVRPVLGERIDVHVRCVDEIAGADSGKFRYVVSQVDPTPHGGREAVAADG